MVDALETFLIFRGTRRRCRKGQQDLTVFRKGNAVLHLGRNKLGEAQLECSFAEKAMGVLVDTMVNVSP